MKKLLSAILVSALLLSLFTFSFAATGQITNLTVNGTTSPGSYAIGGAFTEGAVVWSDRSWETVSCVIDEMRDATIITTRFADKAITTEDMITFTVTENAAVYVYSNYEAQKGVIPWAQDWTRVGSFETINGTTTRTMHIYKKLYPAGSTVVLGGSGSYSNIMYGIAVDLTDVYIPVVPEITNLTVKGSGGASSYVADGSFTTGAVIWSDRSWETVASVPEGMEGAKVIKTRYADNGIVSDDMVSFDINVNSEVYVYINYEANAEVIPWAMDWTYVGTFETVNSSNSAKRTMHAYKKIFPADSTVVLGGPGRSSNLMYGVSVVMDENIVVPKPVFVPTISNLTVKGTTNTASYVVDGNFTTGAVLWSDRNWETVTSVPAGIEGAKIIRTHFADKGIISDDMISFDINENSEVYVYINYKAQKEVIPWAQEWEEAGTFTTSSRTMYVYKKVFKAGSKVVLGGPDKSTNLMYGVAVVMDENVKIKEIENLTIKNSANPNGYAIDGKFAVGSVIWTDRNWETVTESLDVLDGAQVIQTYSADGNSENRDSEKDDISFDITARAEVYVFSNFEAGKYSTPFAMGWINVGQFKTSSRTMHVYKRTYQAGSKVVLGGSGSGSNLMYGVAVKWVDEPLNQPAVIFPEIYCENTSGITFGTVAETYEQKNLTEWGIVFSKTVCEPTADREGCTVYNSYFPLNAKGQFGVQIVGLSAETDYYTRVFAIYGEGEDAVTVYSDAKEFTLGN